MDLQILAQIALASLQALQLGVKFAPAIINNFTLTVRLIMSGTELTEAQRNQARNAHAAAHAALQAQVALAKIEDDQDAAEQEQLLLKVE